MSAKIHTQPLPERLPDELIQKLCGNRRGIVFAKDKRVVVLCLMLLGNTDKECENMRMNEQV